MGLSDPPRDSFIDCIVYRHERVLLRHALDAGELLVTKHRDDGRADPDSERTEASLRPGLADLPAIFSVDK